MDFRNSSSGNTAAKFLFCLKLINLTLLLFIFSSHEGRSQSNLVFVEPFSFAFTLNPGPSNVPASQNIVVADSFCLKITQASIHQLDAGAPILRNDNGDNAFTLTFDDAVLLSYPVGSFHPPKYHDSDMNFWVNSGTKSLVLRKTGSYAFSWRVKLSGVKYKIVPLE